MVSVRDCSEGRAVVEWGRVRWQLFSGGWEGGKGRALCRPGLHPQEPGLPCPLSLHRPLRLCVAAYPHLPSSLVWLGGCSLQSGCPSSRCGSCWYSPGHSRGCDARSLPGGPEHKRSLAPARPSAIAGGRGRRCRVRNLGQVSRVCNDLQGEGARPQSWGDPPGVCRGPFQRGCFA